MDEDRKKKMEAMRERYYRSVLDGSDLRELDTRTDEERLEDLMATFTHRGRREEQRFTSAKNELLDHFKEIILEGIDLMELTDEQLFGQILAMSMDDTRSDEIREAAARLGDLLAHTIDLSEPAPEVPDEPCEAMPEEAIDPPPKAIVVCSECTQKLRLPLDRGALVVTCPKCNHRWTWSP